MKKESKFSRVKKMADRAQTYTATMTPKTLDALDSLDGSRSGKIEKAVKAFYGIGG